MTTEIANPYTLGSSERKAFERGRRFERTGNPYIETSSEWAAFRHGRRVEAPLVGPQDGCGASVMTDCLSTIDLGHAIVRCDGSATDVRKHASEAHGVEWDDDDPRCTVVDGPLSSLEARVRQSIADDVHNEANEVARLTRTDNPVVIVLRTIADRIARGVDSA